MSKEEKPDTKTSNIIIAIFIIIVIGILGISFYSAFSSGGNYDEFTKCITDSGAKMYGAYWCPHCQEQKSLFGKSWDKVNYIECSLPNRGGQTQFCNSAGIKSYPTWEFSDGSISPGLISLQQLSQKTGCQL
jgi:thiol-disulfide isomerase/thioredoxin